MTFFLHGVRLVCSAFLVIVFLLARISELILLRTGNANWIPRIARSTIRSVSNGSTQKHPSDEGCGIHVATQVFACGEDSHALRLISELILLRTGNANWIPRIARSTIRSASNGSTQKHPSDEGCFCVELLPRFELGTSSLPRMCSTN